jgi:outer membrane protein TolC
VCSIDLGAALRLAGANNLQIALAVERVSAAEARLLGAKALWLPSIDVGVGYNQHSGRIQDTSGRILDTTRSALFVGGGPVVGLSSLTGGSGIPPRLTLGLPLSDALFARLVERQTERAAQAGLAATFNDTLLRIGLAYLDLLAAEEQVAIARDAVKNAGELVRLVQSRVKAGTAPPADGLRAAAELADRQRQVWQAQEAVRVASAEVARLLRLPAGARLVPAETQPVPIDLVALDAPLPELLGHALANRPEMAQYQALAAATRARLRQEQWRPWVPALQVGLSSGGFGGSEGNTIGNFGGRTDFEALLVWELKNLGVGNLALKRERASQHRQAVLSAEQVHDDILAEVVRAYQQAKFRHEQIKSARAQLEAAAEALPLNFKGIMAGALRAIEAQQAVQALALAQGQYLNAVVDYNRAQFRLLRALGQPLTAATRE